MVNILRMDLLRFRSNKLVPLLLVLFFGFHTFGIFMMKQYAAGPAGMGPGIGEMNESQFFQYTMSYAPSWVLLYLTVFSVYFYMSEYQSGFYKNYISLKNARIYSVLSKILILGLFTCLLLIVVVGSDIAGRFLFLDNGSLGSLVELVKALAGQFLLHWAFAVLILFVAILVKSQIAGLIVGLVLALNVVGMSVSALESLAGWTGISRYLLVQTIVTLKDYSKPGELVHSLLVASVFLLVFAFVAVRRKLREDLR